MGLAAQIYGLRSEGDCGAGHFGAVAQLAESAAGRGADLVALSPAHALFLADENHYTPYSPSSRLFYNAHYADPVDIFGRERVAANAARVDADANDSSNLIDWPRAARARIALLRALHADFCATDLSAGSPLEDDFLSFRAAGAKHSNLTPSSKRFTRANSSATLHAGIGAIGRRNCAIPPLAPSPPSRVKMRPKPVFTSSPNGSSTARWHGLKRGLWLQACASVCCPISPSA